VFVLVEFVYCLGIWFNPSVAMYNTRNGIACVCCALPSHPYVVSDFHPWFSYTYIPPKDVDLVTPSRMTSSICADASPNRDFN